MKKTLYSLLAITLTAFTLTSCEDVPAPYDDPNDNPIDEPEVIEPAGDGTLANPFNVAATIAEAEKLASGEETTEEIYQSSGISTEVVDEDEILTGNILNAIRARTPWLFITLLGEFIAVNVAHHFDHTIAALPIVAIFMPLLAGLGGNIGTQSITLMVRGLSTGPVTLSSAFHHILREMLIGLVIGSIFGMLVTMVTWGWQHNIELGIVVGIAMMISSI